MKEVGSGDSITEGNTWSRDPFLVLGILAAQSCAVLLHHTIIKSQKL